MAAKQDKPKADWVELDVATLDASDRTAYETYKAQYKVMREARERFEEGMQIMAPEGKRLVFGYNFGKLSCAVVDDDAKPKAKGAVSLSQLIRRA